MRFLHIAVLMLVGIGSAHAGNFRVGVGLGRATVEADDIALEDNTTAFEGFLGWEFNRWLAVEVGYIDGGKAKDTIFGAVIEADTSAWAASVVGSLPIGDSFSVFARAGGLHWKADEEARINGTPVARTNVNGDDVFYGAGIAGLVDNALLRLEYRFADLDDTNLKLWSAAIVWRF